MNTDIRVSVALRSNIKFRRLHRAVGVGAMHHLIALWTEIALARPTGILSGWTADDIEDLADWQDRRGALVDALLSAGFLDRDEDGTFSPHDWEEHQKFVVNEPVRRGLAKKKGSVGGKRSAEARKEKYGSAQPVRPEAEPEAEPEAGPNLRAFPGLSGPFRTEPRSTPLARSPRETPRETPAPDPPPAPPVIEIPTNRNGEAVPVTAEQVAAWQETYPAVDVPGTLRRIRSWCEANPSKRKTARGVPRFIDAWLSREQDRGGNGYSRDPPETEAPNEIDPDEGLRKMAAAGVAFAQGVLARREEIRRREAGGDPPEKETEC